MQYNKECGEIIQKKHAGRCFNCPFVYKNRNLTNKSTISGKTTENYFPSFSLTLINRKQVKRETHAHSFKLDALM